mmetsp:Transcript_129597/g.415558  ORF Transcript_129597/g.415558 Transcript_129597/m.415558 type:complete len:283 (+) Transcript_129597:4135-4983(+)
MSSRKPWVAAIASAGPRPYGSCRPYCGVGAEAYRQASARWWLCTRTIGTATSAKLRGIFSLFSHPAPATHAQKEPVAPQAARRRGVTMLAAPMRRHHALSMSRSGGAKRFGSRCTSRRSPPSAGGRRPAPAPWTASRTSSTPPSAPSAAPARGADAPPRPPARRRSSAGARQRRPTTTEPSMAAMASTRIRNWAPSSRRAASAAAEARPRLRARSGTSSPARARCCSGAARAPSRKRPPSGTLPSSSQVTWTSLRTKRISASSTPATRSGWRSSTSFASTRR